MSDDLTRLPFLVRLSKKTSRVIYQNLSFGIFFIILGIAAGGGGWLPAAYAAVLHFAGSLIVVFNSARLVRYGEELDHGPQV
jgi:Cd2+/Zn2+-exporting ATPase